MNTIFAKKVKMTTKYDANGKRVGATVLEVPQMKVSTHLTSEKNGYTAIQFEIEKKHREVRVPAEDLSSFAVGSEVGWSEIFKAGDKVSVSGVSRGKGWTGVVKRYGFRGGPRTHGQSDRERAPGSSGQTTTPGKVYKGKKMAGRMGGERVSISGLKIIEVLPEARQIILAGSIPGNEKVLVEVSKV
jgi:large subunit ribosomal protein L3